MARDGEKDEVTRGVGRHWYAADTGGGHGPSAEVVVDLTAAVARLLVLVGGRMEAGQLESRVSAVAPNRANKTCSRVPVWHGRSDCDMDLNDIARADRETAAQMAV